MWLFPWLKRLGMSFNPFQEQEDWFRSVVRDTIEAREKQNIFRPDMINLLMEVRKEMREGRAKTQWTDDELVAQCAIFFGAGFDTVSSTASYMAYELIINPDVQQKLYEECSAVHKSLGGKPIDYETLHKMKYLDQVIQETLRKWPSVPVLDRKCVKDYMFDNGEFKFKIEKDTRIQIPTIGLHMDPKLYPEPEKFDPDRFDGKNSVVPGTQLGFGIGPRMCIGNRFALMEIKALFFHLILNFSFERNEKTQIPVQLVRSFTSIESEKGIHAELKPRRKI